VGGRVATRVRAGCGITVGIVVATGTTVAGATTTVVGASEVGVWAGISPATGA